MSDQDTLLEFPCEFPIKAMGLADGTFDTRVVEIINRHVEDPPEGAIRRRPSAKGKYLSVTVTIRATSREQLDDIYRELTACEEVLMAL